LKYQADSRSRPNETGVARSSKRCGLSGCPAHQHGVHDPITRSVRTVLELIKVSFGTVITTIRPGEIAYTAGAATVSWHWMETFIAEELIEPADVGLLLDAPPQSWRLTRTALELLAA
jgi:hypothetical protein